MERLFLLAVLTLFFLGAASLQAQTATFAYSSIQSNNCSPITKWNGVLDASPEDMGVLQLLSQSVFWDRYPVAVRASQQWLLARM